MSKMWKSVDVVLVHIVLRSIHLERAGIELEILTARMKAAKHLPSTY